MLASGSNPVVEDSVPYIVTPQKRSGLVQVVAEHVRAASASETNIMFRGLVHTQPRSDKTIPWIVYAAFFESKKPSFSCALFAGAY